MSKYIDADLLIRKIKGQIRLEIQNFAALGSGRRKFCINMLEWVLKQIDSLQQEQPEQDITEFEKALNDFGDAYATLVDRDNNPNIGIHCNAYHELVQERVNEILSLAKEYVKREQLDDQPEYGYLSTEYVHGKKPWWSVGDVLAYYICTSNEEGEYILGKIVSVEFDEEGGWIYTFEDGSASDEQTLVEDGVYKKN